MLPSFRVLLSRPIRLTGALLLAGAVLAVPSLAAGLDVTIVGHPALDTTSTSASFTWSRTGTVSRTQCKLDDAAYANCGASKSYSGLTEGTHTFSVRVEGGGDAAVDTFTWQIDRTAPSVPSVSGGSLTWVKTSVVLSASGATDPGGSGVKSHQHRTSADGGATWSTAATGTPFSVTTAGESITQFRAVDRAGNVSAWAPAVAGVDNTARVDKASPVVPVLTGSSTAWQNVGSATITGGGSTDVLSGFDHYQYRTSADKGVTWSAAVEGDTFSASSEGETQVQMRSVDAAGNVSAWVLGYLRIDRTAPTAPTVTGGGTNWLGMDTATITASASTDAPGSGVEHYESQTSTDAGVTWSTVVTGKSLVVGGEGETQVRMRAVDRFGHVSGWSQTSVKLDTANPTVPTVSGGSSTWRNIASVVVSASGATDSPGSGLLGYQVRKSTNGGATWGFPMNGSAITITAAGETLLQFRSTDNSGRHSAWAPASPTSGSRVRIDRTAPSAPTVSNSSSSWRDVASVTVDASGSSDGSGYVAGLSGYEFQVSTDGGSSWTAAVAGSSYTISAEGQTLVRYSALDNAGNRSGWTTATVRIDRTDPTAPTSVSGGSLSWRNWSSVTVSPSGATDSPGSGVAGYQYRTSTDGGLTWSAAQSGTAQISAEGERVVQIRSVDAYGHVSGWFPSTPVAAGTVRLDRTAPAAPSVSGGSSTWQNIASLTVSAGGGSDALSGFVGLSTRPRRMAARAGRAVRPVPP